MDELKNRFRAYQSRLRSRALVMLWNLLLSWFFMELIGDIEPTSVPQSKLIFWIAAALFPLLVPAASVFLLLGPYINNQTLLSHDELYHIWCESMCHRSVREVEAIHHVFAQEGFWRIRKAMLDTGVLKVGTLIYCGGLLLGNIMATILAYAVDHTVFHAVLFALPLTIWWICCKLNEEYIIVRYILSASVTEEMS